MNVNDLKLRTKAFIPLGLLAVTIVAMVAFGAGQLHDVSARAKTIIEKRDAALFKMVRASRFVVQLPYAVDASILNDDGTAASVGAERDIKTAPQEIDALFAAAAEDLPDHAAEILRLRERAAALGRQAKSILEDGAGLPGLDHGRRLKPEELDALAVASLRSAELDGDARKLIADIVAVDDHVLAENVAAAGALAAASSRAILALSALGLVSAALAVGFSFWMTSSKIERPLQRLSLQMRSLAGGDVDTEIVGRERGDEIGDMARAVEVFKSNALSRREAEAREASARAAHDSERERATAQRLSAAETQSAALTALREGLKRMSEGDLLIRLEEGFSSEFAEVRDDFNAAAGKLKAALAAVAQSADAIHSSTREISNASDNLSQRTEQQAASLEQTAAALEEITNTLKQSAQGATHAAAVVATADADAKKGAVVVRKAVEAMDAIAESSNKIGQIIGVIDEIAFQTNLLALNAGVEAARAGDSGKGFAVVASEVRALAQRSAEAAKEIKSLVSTSGAQVESGVKLVAESGKALESIIAQVSEINSVVAEIASGAQQQATGLQQINVAISQMDQSTQQNATMVEESTAASHSLSQEMTELSKLVEQFHVGEAADGRLRRDLKAAAPHAFVKATSQPARAFVKAAPQPARPAAKGELRPVKTAANADWTEF